MHTLLILTMKEFEDWKASILSEIKWDIVKEYPNSFPAIVVWNIHTNHCNASDFVNYTFIYPCDFPRID